MSTLRTVQDMFKRYRRPGDLVFAACFFSLAVFLLIQIPEQTTWVKRTQLFAQPAFWPALAIAFLVLCSGLYLLGALVSARIPGRRDELIYWLRSLEWVVWFMVYVFFVPKLGYLLSSLVFAPALAYRAGYRKARWLFAAAGFSLAVVVIFKALLQVKIPAGDIYSLLPEGSLRTFLMTYL